MIEVDPQSPVPLYLQIAEAIRRLIALGALRPGERLPTVRDLAVRARVNRNTAARAIQHLESEGIVRARVGQGTYVDEAPVRIATARLEEQIDRRIDDLLIEAETLGMPLDRIAPRVGRRVESFRRRQASARRQAGAGDEESHR